jgi:aspartokinase-like uncharacterized kinase
MPSKCDLKKAWAIKIGGSLYASKYLTQWLGILHQVTGTKIIIIPGGGPFADQVRQADEKFSLNHIQVHNMAVMAMQQYGNMLASLSPDLIAANSIDVIYAAWEASKVVIWEPYEMVRDECELEKSWQVTSDSLAVWLASKLKINNLLLVKSTKQVLKKTSLSALTASKCIDPGLQKLATNYHINIHFLHKSKSSDLLDTLNTV